jgi:hypothetical protein
MKQICKILANLGRIDDHAHFGIDVH